MLLRRITKHVKDQNWFAVFLDFFIVVAGILLAFQITSWNEERGERNVGVEYLQGFRHDLSADAQILQTEIEARNAQLENALTVLQYFDGRSLDVQVFFEAYYAALYTRNTLPNRNTMDEVINSGNLRLIHDESIRTGLLDLYAKYEVIEKSEALMAWTFEQYLYDPTFSSVRANIEGPWEDTPTNHAAAAILLDNLTIENGFRLIVLNLRYGDNQGLLPELEAANLRVENLLKDIQSE